MSPSGTPEQRARQTIDALDFLHGDVWQSELVLGNTLLATVIAGYDTKARKQPHHTVDAGLHLLSSRDIASPLCEDPPMGIAMAEEFFIGYLMLDALIGNTDRHHENWGLIVRRWQDQVAVLRPTRLERTSDRLSRWSCGSLHRRSITHRHSAGTSTTKSVRDDWRPRECTAGEHYCARGKSPFFATATSPQPLSVREVFRRACECLPEAGGGWLRRLREVPVATLHATVDQLPASIASEAARDFAKAVLTSNRNFLLSLPW